MRKAQIKEALLKNLDGNKVCEDLKQNDKEYKLYNNGNTDQQSISEEQQTNPTPNSDALAKESIDNHDKSGTAKVPTVKTNSQSKEL